MVLGWARAGRPLEKSILGFLGMLKAKRMEQAKEVSILIRIETPSLLIVMSAAFCL